MIDLLLAATMMQAAPVRVTPPARIPATANVPARRTIAYRLAVDAATLGTSSLTLPADGTAARIEVANRYRLEARLVPMWWNGAWRYDVRTLVWLPDHDLWRLAADAQFPLGTAESVTNLDDTPSGDIVIAASTVG